MNSGDTSTRLVGFHVPEDQALLAAFGEVALRHEHMNHILRMTIKTLAGITPAEAFAATKYESSRQLRDRIKGLARKALGEGAALLKLQAIVNSCEELTERRNQLVHGVWAKELDGDAHIRDSYGNERPLPTIAELKELAGAIDAHTRFLNSERLDGFLSEALKKRGNTISKVDK
ncbi:MAG: hypothetical protein KF771_11320 [Burkholderiales bacterium]|nr:hypothetical protein [Burkholderiales bacterium]